MRLSFEEEACATIHARASCSIVYTLKTTWKIMQTNNCVDDWVTKTVKVFDIEKVSILLSKLWKQDRITISRNCGSFDKEMNSFVLLDY